MRQTVSGSLQSNFALARWAFKKGHNWSSFRKLRVFLKLRVFSVFCQRPEAVLFINVVFAATGYWKVWAAILVVCRRSGNRTSLCWAQICILTGTLVPSLLWHFLILYCFTLFSVKIISTLLPEKMANTRILQIQALPGNSVQRLPKMQYKNWHYGSKRSRDLHMHQQKPELSIFQTGKQTNCKTCLEIFIIFLLFIYFNFHILYSEKKCHNCMSKQVWIRVLCVG